MVLSIEDSQGKKNLESQSMSAQINFVRIIRDKSSGFDETNSFDFSIFIDVGVDGGEEDYDKERLSSLAVAVK